MHVERILSSSPFLYTIFTEMPCGAALHKLVCDENGKAIDYYVTEVNPQFSALMNIEPEDVIGKRASLRLPQEELNHWLDILAPVALEGKNARYRMYSPYKRKTFTSTAICPQKGYFFVMFVAEDH